MYQLNNVKMDFITLKLDQEPVTLNGDLLLKAYRDTRIEIVKGASKSITTMGIVNIAGLKRYVSITISNELD